jgi:hypothetical protein
VEVSYFAVDASGKVRGGNTDTVTLNLRPETKARVEQDGFRMLNRLELAPGRYTLRVAARDAVGGNIGSVSYDLDVPDYHTLPFSMSGLVLTSMSGSAMMTARPDEQMRSVLPAAPIALRTFPQNDEIALFAEVYDRAANVPHAVDIITTLRSDEGTIVFRHEEERRSSELQGPGALGTLGAKTGGYGYQARVPLSDVPPGLYVLTVDAQSRLGDHPTASRQVQFTVSAAPLQGLQGATPMRLLDKGDHSNMDDARQAVARTAGDWKTLWQQHSPDRPQPQVDFAKEMVVGVFLGSRPTAGFTIEVVGVAQKDAALVVQYRQTQPSRDAVTAQVITSPYHLVALPTFAGDVRFERAGQ